MNEKAERVASNPASVWPGSFRISRRRVGRSALLTAASLLLTAAVASAAIAHVRAATPPGFSWFVPAPPPTGWHSLALAKAAVLYYPPSLHRIQAHPWAVSAAQFDKDGKQLAYLNATEQQGAENLKTWPKFRLDILRAVSASSVRERARAVGLAFRGGSVGSCVIDDYVTRTGHHAYREIACFVTGLRGGSVVIAAAPPSQWPRVGRQLERAVSTYLAK